MRRSDGSRCSCGSRSPLPHFGILLPSASFNPSSVASGVCRFVAVEAYMYEREVALKLHACEERMKYCARMLAVNDLTVEQLKEAGLDDTLEYSIIEDFGSDRYIEKPRERVTAFMYEKADWSLNVLKGEQAELSKYVRILCSMLTRKAAFDDWIKDSGKYVNDRDRNNYIRHGDVLSMRGLSPLCRVYENFEDAKRDGVQHIRYYCITRIGRWSMHAKRFESIRRGTVARQPSWMIR